MSPSTRWDRTGLFAKIGFSVPDERDDAGTVKLSVQLPQDHPLAFVSVQSMSGWEIATTTRTMEQPLEGEGQSITEVVDTVTWTATGDTQIAGVSSSCSGSPPVRCRPTSPSWPSRPCRPNPAVRTSTGSTQPSRARRNQSALRRHCSWSRPTAARTRLRRPRFRRTKTTAPTRCRLWRWSSAWSLSSPRAPLSVVTRRQGRSYAG